MAKTPRVGVGVFVFNEDGQFIVGRRKGSIGAGTIALPGGHLEFNEAFEACAEREVLEETGVEVQNVRFLTAVNTTHMELPRAGETGHYVTIFMTCGMKNARDSPKVLEPDKCAGWMWFTWERLQTLVHAQGAVASTSEQLFEPIINLVHQRPDVRPSLA